MIEYQGARIQLLDLPGIVEGASQGNLIGFGSKMEIVLTYYRAWTRQTGRIKYIPFLTTSMLPLIAALAAKTADLILIMLDATKSEEQRRLLEIELDAVGIRLNREKPDVVFKRRTTGGSVPCN